MPVNRLLKELTSAEIAEYMAFDSLKDEHYMATVKSKMMTDEERIKAFDKIFGVK